jgi:predicted ATPase
MTLSLSFSKLGPIKLNKRVEIRIGKTILYGGNGQGKSTIIRAIIRLILKEKDDSILNHVTQEINDKYYWVWIKNSSDAFLHDLLNNRQADFEHPGLIDNPRISRIIGDTLYIYSKDRRGEASRDVIDAANPDHLFMILSEPEIAEKAEEFFAWLDVPIIDFYHGYYREKGLDWLDVSNLPYGYRRALMMIYALEKSDYLFIEGFENGLHIDLMLMLLDLFSKVEGKVTVVETHNSFPIVYGLKKGWRVYYIKRSDVVEIANYDQLREKADLFLRELMVLKSEM